MGLWWVAALWLGCLTEAATLTPALSLKREGKKGPVDGWGGGGLVGDAEGVHALVDSFAGLVEGFFEVGLVVVVAVVVGGVTGGVLGAALADVLDAAVDEGEHVAGSLIAPHGPVALPGGDVDG